MIEKSGGDRVTKSMREFNEVIDALNVEDIPLKNGLFTWTNLRERPVCTSIDRFFQSKRWFEFFKDVILYRQARMTLDHFPLQLNLEI